MRRVAACCLAGIAWFAPAPLGGQSAEALSSLRAAGDTVRLEAALAAALAAPVSNGAVQLSVAQIRYEQGRYAEASVAARAALRADEKFSGVRAWALVLLGQTAFLGGDTAEARARLAAAAALPQSGRPSGIAARLARSLGVSPAYAGWRTTETEHLRVHLPPDTRLSDPVAWAAQREGALARMQQFFGARLPKKIDIFVWTDQAAASAAGLPQLGFADPALAVVHTLPDQTRGHEIAHVVAWLAGGSPPNERRTRLVSEGTSVLFNGERQALLAQARAGMRASAYGPVSVEGVWADRGSVPAQVMYPVAGLIVQRLVERGGRERFLKLLADQRLESARAIYGDLLTQVVADVERELNAS